MLHSTRFISLGYYCSIRELQITLPSLPRVAQITHSYRPSLHPYARVTFSEDYRGHVHVRVCPCLRLLRLCAHGARFPTQLQCPSPRRSLPLGAAEARQRPRFSHAPMLCSLRACLVPLGELTPSIVTLHVSSLKQLSIDSFIAERTAWVSFRASTSSLRHPNR